MSHAYEHGAVRPPKADWTPARLFLAASAVYHLALGAVGLAINQSFPFSPAKAERADSALGFGVFETNGWHSTAALVLGVISLIVAIWPRRAREVALALGASHIGIVLALVVFDPSTFLLASNAADQVIHVVTAIGGTATALLTPRTEVSSP